MKYLSMLVILFCIGCSPPGSENDVNPEHTYKTVTIEGHEYIFISRRPWSVQMAIAHAGHCTAPHIFTKEES